MSDELYHFGVKGMKWGIRHDKNRSGSSRSRKKKRVASEDYTRSRDIMKKKPYEMSNRELQEANKRLQLENNYKNNYNDIGKKIVDRFEQTSVQKIADMAAGAIVAYGVAKGGSLLKQYGPTLLNNLGR
jgi:ribosome-binding ATPase YchF (GTP1/OBG family)